MPKVKLCYNYNVITMIIIDKQIAREKELFAVPKKVYKEFLS